MRVPVTHLNHEGSDSCVREEELLREPARCKTYGVATISRLLKIIRLFEEHRSLL